MTEAEEQTQSRRQDRARIALGLMLASAGTSHLTVARQEFRAQVPDSLPLPTDTVVLLSGIAEISLGVALLALPRQKARTGAVAAAFFTAIFPATSPNISITATPSAWTPTANVSPASSASRS